MYYFTWQFPVHCFIDVLVDEFQFSGVTDEGKGPRCLLTRGSGGEVFFQRLWGPLTCFLILFLVCMHLRAWRVAVHCLQVSEARRRRRTSPGRYDPMPGMQARAPGGGHFAEDLAVWRTNSTTYVAIRVSDQRLQLRMKSASITHGMRSKPSRNNSRA